METVSHSCSPSPDQLRYVAESVWFRIGRQCTSTEREALARLSFEAANQAGADEEVKRNVRIRIGVSPEAYERRKLPIAPAANVNESQPVTSSGCLLVGRKSAVAHRLIADRIRWQNFPIPCISDSIRTRLLLKYI